MLSKSCANNALNTRRPLQLTHCIEARHCLHACLPSCEDYPRKNKTKGRPHSFFFFSFSPCFIFTTSSLKQCVCALGCVRVSLLRWAFELVQTHTHTHSKKKNAHNASRSFSHSLAQIKKKKMYRKQVTTHNRYDAM